MIQGGRSSHRCCACTVLVCVLPSVTQIIFQNLFVRPVEEADAAAFEQGDVPGYGTEDVLAPSGPQNATKTYAELKEEYLTLKALLNVSGVNMTDIDRIKERVSGVFHYNSPSARCKAFIPASNEPSGRACTASVSI